MLRISDVCAKVLTMEAKYSERDSRMDAVRQVRAGKISSVFPDFYGEDLAHPMVSNFIDIVARDLAEKISPLPAINCLTGNMTSDRAKQNASRRQRIAAHYWRYSNLQIQMFGGVDQYITYGFKPFIIEPDYENNLPRIRLLDSFGCYPEMNLRGDCVSLTRKWLSKASTLAAQYPDKASRLLSRGQFGQVSDSDLWVYRYEDKDQTLVFIKERDNLVLEQFSNPLGECPVVVAVRPSPDDQMRGQFDDVLGVQAARALMMRLAVEGAEKSVQAPLAVPDDVTEIATGPDAVLRTQFPEKVRRVNLELPNSTFTESAALAQELKDGARYPQQRTGSQPGSIVTGRGVEALMDGFDSQVKTAQTIFADALRKVTRLCFMMDEKLFGNISKDIFGTQEGAPFQMTYKPSRDINGDYTCDITYGFMAGLDFSRALVAMLQLHGDKVIDRATLQRNLPFDMDLTQLQQNIDVEEMRDALKAGLLALTQNIGPYMQGGGDVAQILGVLAKVVKGRQGGQALEDLLSEQFSAMQEQQKQQAQEAQQQAAQQAAEQGGGPGGEGIPPQIAGRPAEGVAPGQAGMNPGGRPDLQTLMASLGSNGKPNLTAGVRRARPAY